jgi:hypothetical protein
MDYPTYPQARPYDPQHKMADFEALKDQWSDIEDRDGVRLSWNTFPSSRMVGPHAALIPRSADQSCRKRRASLCPSALSTRL